MASVTLATHHVFGSSLPVVPSTQLTQSYHSKHIPILWCNNIRAIYLLANPIFHAHTKHIEVDYHFICDKVAKKELYVLFISFKD